MTYINVCYLKQHKFLIDFMFFRCQYQGRNSKRNTRFCLHVFLVDTFSTIMQITVVNLAVV